MSENIDAMLLMSGNETVKSLRSENILQKAPKGSWEISYIVENSSLAFNIFLNYDIFIRNLAGILIDPPLWITIVALFAAAQLEVYTSTLPQDLRISFCVNGHEEEKDWKASCTIQKLLKAREDGIGKPLTGIVPIMMMAMELESR